MYTKTFETNRLLLRKGMLSDIDDIYNSYASRDKVTEFLSWQTHGSIEDTRQYIENIVLPSYKQEYYSWFLQLKETGKVVGNISIVNFNKEKKCCELGWVLSDDYWGQGLMPEAAAVILEFAKSLGFIRIEARHNIANPKSGRVMQKIRMKFEGIRRKGALDNNGNLIDMAIYSFIVGED